MFETICSIRTKCWWNSHWMVLFQKYVRRFGPSTKMAPTAKLSLTLEPMGNSHKNLWMVLFQNCVRQSRSPTKMAATVQLRCYWKPLWSRWAITGSWEPLVCLHVPFQNCVCWPCSLSRGWPLLSNKWCVNISGEYLLDIQSQ